MTTVSIFEAKTNLSRYVATLTERREPFIVITRNGKPAAKLIPYEEDTSARIGIAKGRIPMLESLDEFNSIDAASEFYMREDV